MQVSQKLKSMQVPVTIFHTLQIVTVLNQAVNVTTGLVH